MGGVFASRTRAPAPLFLVLQAAAGLVAGVSLTYLITQLDTAPSLQRLYQLFASYEPLDIAEATGPMRGFVNDVIWNPTRRRLPRGFFLLYFGLPALLIAPATLLMGISFPILQRAVQSSPGRLGGHPGSPAPGQYPRQHGGHDAHRVGAAVRRRNSRDSEGHDPAVGPLRLRCLAAPSQGPGSDPYRRACALCVCGGDCAIVTPSGTRLWAALRGTASQRLIVAEDEYGVSVLRGRDTSFEGNVTVFVNGLGQSQLPYGGIRSNT